MLRKLVPFLTLTAILCAPLAANAASFHVHNESNATIAYLLVSPAENPYWSHADEMLGSDQYIGPGQNWDFDFAAGDDCVFDMRAVFTNGQAIVRYNVDFCAYYSPIWTLY
jgi:hypothetical protein